MNKKYAPESRGVFFIVSVADNRKFETRLGFQGRRKPTSRPVQPAPREGLAKRSLVYEAIPTQIGML